jgi:sulfite reductase (NADPH) flavoprotein alpha-component
MCSIGCCNRPTRCARGSHNGAAIYVCGSLQGMASGVDAALRQIAGDAFWRELSATGRYRRDVY